ncbi:rhomboid family intramembrane serine protease [Falsibacillus pallidus]|uniref:rhomboid family intramembrane serine protease n=1 Tax=Falsibacillus pallidus TaxID=493781 RepID=UPI003D96A128
MNGLDVKKEWLFWKIAYELIEKNNYRLLKISSNQNEIWMENVSQKQAPIIRLTNHDVDWSNRLQQEIEWTARNGENIRKAFHKRNVRVQNVYISDFPPVDDYQFRLEKPFTSSDQKVEVETIMILMNDWQNGVHQLNSLLQPSSPISIDASTEFAAVEDLQRTMIQTSAKREEKERGLFEFGKPFFTYIFLGIQVIMFLLLEISGGSTNSETLIKFGAKYNPLILQGEWWRFFAPIFLHIGLLHLLMNSLALYFLGPAVEKIYGRLRFLWIYLFAGFSGSVASFVFSDHLSAGASGAIFGCFGALLYFGSVYPNLFFRTMGTNVLVVIGINLVFGFTSSGIDNAGHIGGLIGGFIATGTVHFPKQKKQLKQLLFLLIALAASAGFLFYGYRYSAANQGPDSVNILAQEYIQDKKYSDAQKLLEDYLNSHDGNALTYFFLSFAEMKEEAYPSAKEHLQKAVKLEPSFHEAHYNLALLYYDEGDYVQAKQEVEKALKYSDDKKYKTLLDQLESLSGSSN